MNNEKYIQEINQTLLKSKNFKVIEIHGKPTIRNNCSMHCTIHGDGNSWGNPWKPTIRSIKQGKGCPKCSKRYIYTEEEIVLDINSNIENKNIQIKSVMNYKNTTSRCIMTCKVHGDSNQWDKPWLPRLSDLKDGCGCPKCSHELKDIYKLFNQPNHEGFNTKTKIYFIKFKRKNKTFSKIGITQQQMNQRFKPYNLNKAEINIVDCAFLELPTLKALLLEFYILNKYSHLKEYQPSLKKYMIGGATECFSSNINNFINLKKELNFIENNYISLINELINENIISKENKTTFINNFNTIKNLGE